ncbi:MAG: LPXTG cell wall anchor domain-containing protein [Candidatus Bathyarchaeia archaeon]|jgi:LPXTG-motif cell wall-anchored protein
MNSSYQGVFYSSVIPFSLVTGQATVSGVSDGVHSLTVYVKFNETYHSNSQTVRFTAGNPTVSLNVAGNQNFEVNSTIPYSIDVSIPYAWFINDIVYGKVTSIGYTLDSVSFEVVNELSVPRLSVVNRNLTFTGNLSGLLLGNHELKAYLTWVYPKDSTPATTISETTAFSVGTQTAQWSNSLTDSVTFAALGAIALLLVILFLLFFKRKKKSVSIN